MALGPKDPEMRKRAWRSAAFAAAALLVMPLLAWLILPAPPKVPLPQIVAATVEAAPRPRAKPTPIPSPIEEPRQAEAPSPTPEAPAVRGRVMGPNRQAVPRVWVGCTDKEVNTVSELDGTFELPAEANGCSAVARKPGYGASAPVTLRAGDERTNTLELRGGGKIEGVVVDDGGAAIPKFTLSVEKFIGQSGDEEGSGGRARTIEDDKGQFTMDGLTPGKYVFSVSAEGHAPAHSDTLEVESGRTLSGVRIVVSKGISLTGVVTDAETRKPIAEARVSLDAMTWSGPGAAGTKTDENGAYTLEAVPANGPFSIRVSKDGYRTRIMSGLQARGATQMKSDVELTKRDEDAGVDSELGGIGVVLAPQPGAFGAMVVTVTPDGPAAQAGIQRLDSIMRIDGAATDSMMIHDCIQRLRGDPGTRVSVAVKRGDQELQFNLTRAVVMR